MTITIKGTPGEHIIDAIKRVLALAVENEVDYVLSFNEADVLISPTSTVEAACKAYDHNVEESHRAWEASPEGKEHARVAAEEEAKERKREAAGPVHVEADMQKEKPPWCKTVEELAAYIESQVNGKHDYGTCVYAMSLAAEAAFCYVAGQLSVTGMQASCADLDLFRRTRGLKGPFMVVLAEQLLYPQYDQDEEIREARKSWKPWLRERALEKIRQNDADEFKAHPQVLAHWKKLAKG
jgi:hypothetical protein